MPLRSRRSPAIRSEVIACEARTLTTLVFILNGNAFSAAGPNGLTANAASVLQAAGDRAVQLSYPLVATPAAFHGIADQIRGLSHGESIGLVGFSAGGSIALRLSEVSSLHVTAVLDDYGPPDLRDWFNYHKHDHYARYVLRHVPFSQSAIDLFSGPSDSTAYIAAAFGHRDHNVTVGVSAPALSQDFPTSHVYFYPGGHGVSIAASTAALDDFLAHL